MSAESADIATAFLLAFSMNASRILLAADDLRLSSFEVGSRLMRAMWCSAREAFVRLPKSECIQ